MDRVASWGWRALFAGGLMIVAGALTGSGHAYTVRSDRPRLLFSNGSGPGITPAQYKARCTSAQGEYKRCPGALGSGDGLADALLKLDRASDLVSFQASPATEPLYTVNPFEETGLAAGVLGHPALGVAWLANKLGAMGTALEPGHLVLAGSFTRVVFAQKSDTLHADFGPLGGLAIQFI